MYRYQAVAIPASASQKGALVSPCNANAAGPWNSSLSLASGSCAGSTTIAPSKNPPNSKGSM